MYSDKFACVQFKFSFLNATEHFSNISLENKLLLIRANLRGKALAIITHLPVAPGSFEEAWSLLDKMFCAQEALKNYAINESLQHPAIGTLSEAEGLTFRLNRLKLLELETKCCHSQQ